MTNATKKKAETKVGLKEANDYKAEADHFPAEDWASWQSEHREDFDAKAESFSTGSLLASLPLLDLHPSLAVDTLSAAEGGADVSNDASLNVVFLPGLWSEEQGGNARHDAAKQAADDARLLQALSILVNEAAWTPTAEATCADVSKAIAETLLPLRCHSDFKS